MLTAKQHSEMVGQRFSNLVIYAMRDYYLSLIVVFIGSFIVACLI